MALLPCAGLNFRRHTNRHGLPLFTPSTLPPFSFYISLSPSLPSSLPPSLPPFLLHIRRQSFHPYLSCNNSILFRSTYNKEDLPQVALEYYTIMALPYMEGEVFFRRSALPVASQNFNPENEQNFFSHMLVETVWNNTPLTDVTKPTRREYPSNPHPRAGDAHFDTLPGHGATYVGLFHTSSIMFGNVRDGSTIAHTMELELSLEMAPAGENYYHGDNRVVVRPVPLLATEYMFVDLTMPLRAIYFPVAQQSDASFPDMCTYLMMDFRNRPEIEMVVPASPFLSVFYTTPEMGLGNDHIYDTISINIRDLRALLSLPRQLRDPYVDPFTGNDEIEAPIQWSSCWTVNKNRAPKTTIPSDKQIDLTTIISANLGIDIKWNPYEHNNFVLKLIKNLISVGLDLIPVVGPLLSTEFTIGSTLLFNQGAFDATYGAELATELGADALEGVFGVHQEAARTRKMLPVEWRRIADANLTTTGNALAFPLGVTGGSAVQIPRDRVKKTSDLVADPLFASRAPPPPTSTDSAGPSEGDVGVDEGGQV